MLRRIPVVIILIMCATVLSGCGWSRVDVAQMKSDIAAGELAGDTTLGQTFVSKHADLSAISVMLATYARANTEDVIFHLRSGPSSSEDLVTIKFSAGQVVDNQFREFSFESIPDSEGASYCFFFTSPDSSPGNSITMWKTAQDVYEAGSAFRNGHLVEGDVVFRTYYRETISLARVLAFVIRKFNGDRPFFIFYCSIFVLLLGATLRAWLRPRRKTRRNT